MLTVDRELLRSSADTVTFGTMSQLSQEHLTGKFHAHVTVALADDAHLRELEDFVRFRRAKVTVIDLADNADRTQRDVMVTVHYRSSDPEAVSIIMARLQDLCAELNRRSFRVLRTKLEHESLPTMSQFSDQNYREVHIRVQIPEQKFSETVALLREAGPKLGFVPSTNPRSRVDGAVVQFVNMRHRSGTLDQVQVKVDRVLDFLAENEIPVTGMHEETTVWDSNQEHDSWWA